jgi:hypothetical protein
MTPMPRIAVNFRNYSPPLDIVPTVELLLRHVPPQYLAGLEYIELTNSTSTRKLRRGKTWSRRKKVRMARCIGFYCGDHIQILVDNLFANVPPWMLRWSVSRALLTGEVLYHEIGHHIHTTQIPVYKEPEDVADRWSKYLLRLFVWQQYWYLRPVRIPLARLLRTYRAWRFPDYRSERVCGRKISTPSR